MDTAQSNNTRLRAYLGAESSQGPCWNADATRLAFVDNSTGSFQVYTVGIDDDRPLQVSPGPERATDPRFLPDGRIIYTSDVGGNENFQLLMAGPGSGITRLSPDDGAKYRLVSINQGELFFVANDSDKARFTLYRQTLPITSWDPREIYTPQRGVIQQAHRMPAGELVVELAYGNMDQELILLSQTNPAAPHSLTATLSGSEGVRWHFIRALTDSSMLVATDLKSDLFRPAVLTTAGSIRLIPAIEESIDIEFASAAYRPGAGETYLEFNHEGYSRLYCMSDVSEGRIEQIDLPAQSVIVAGDGRSSRIGMALSPDGSRLAIARSGPDQVTDLWVRTMASDTWHQLTNSGAPGLKATDFRRCTLHRFNSFDDLSVPYFRFLPSAAKQPAAGWPAVVMIHGGPEAQARPAFNPVVQFLTAAGFAVLLPNIRGSAGYGRTYLDLDNREKRLDSIADIAALAGHVTTTDDQIDGDRLAVMGGSYGGFAVLSALTEYPGLWKAGVDIVGISNFVTFLTNTAAWRRKLRESEYGSLDDTELLQRISPINRIEEIVAPLLIIQGDNDERVPLSESIQMFDRLNSLGRTVELMRFDDEGHGVTKLDNRVTAYTRVVEWLIEYL